MEQANAFVNEIAVELGLDDGPDHRNFLVGHKLHVLAQVYAEWFNDPLCKADNLCARRLIERVIRGWLRDRMEEAERLKANPPRKRRRYA